MMPSALSRICRSARAIGPLGSSTPSVQPPSVAAPITNTASRPYRMLDLARAEVDGNGCAEDRVRCEVGARISTGATVIWRTNRRIAVVHQEDRKEREQVEDGENEQLVS